MLKLKKIHVNQHNIKANLKNGNEALPVFTIKINKQNIRARFITINGPSSMVYRPDKPLSCGAKVWIATRSEVIAQTDDGEIRL